MSAIQYSENVSLKGPEDWETWNTQFEITGTIKLLVQTIC
jgi:hypothetical protein